MFGLNIVLGLWQKICVYIAAAAIFMTIGAATTYKYMTGQQAKEVVKELVHVVEKKDDQIAINDGIAGEQIKQDEKIRVVFKTILKEVVKYEKDNPNANVKSLDAEWVRRFNESTKGEPVPASADGAKTTVSQRIEQLVGKSN